MTDNTDKKQYRFLVTIDADTYAQAQHVMTERLGHDEDYGFSYSIEWFYAIFMDKIEELEKKNNEYEENLPQ